jgi:hypothetical protein
MAARGRLRDQGVGEEPQPPAGRDARVELADRAGGSVARIHILLLLRLALARVQRFEVAPVHQHLAAHFQAVLRDFQRDRMNGTQIGGDIFAHGAVAARGPLG